MFIIYENTLKLIEVIEKSFLLSVIMNRRNRHRYFTTYFDFVVQRVDVVFLVELIGCYVKLTLNIDLLYIIAFKQKMYFYSKQCFVNILHAILIIKIILYLSK